MRATLKKIATMTPFARTAVIALAAAAATAAAGDDGRRAVQLLPRYAQECGACHVAYPPGLLPQASWQRLMRDLPNHFGSDASVDAATLKELDTWLAANAGGGRRSAEPPPQDRITRSQWFIREHREMAPALWKSPLVKSTANCAACHTRAAQGDFDEDTIRIPR